MAEPLPSGRSHRTGKAFLTTLRLAAVVAVVFVIWRYWDSAAFNEWKSNAGPLPFFAALAILPLVGIPTTPFYIIAGATFGIVTGLVGSLIALALNLVLSYRIAKGPLRTVFQKWMAKSNREIPTVEKVGALRFTLIVRFTPGVPGFLKHYLIVLAGVPLRIYFPVSLVISGFYAGGFIVLGDSAFDRDISGLVITVAILLTVTALVWWWRRRGKKV
jgi:uncharacterized membrane protein YdjX (TVP38/TMEM64 family)